MTGENFKRIDRSQIKELKARIQTLRDECGEMLNVNCIRENGFDGVRYYKLSKKIEWLEYLLWGLTEK